MSFELLSGIEKHVRNPIASAFAPRRRRCNLCTSDENINFLRHSPCSAPAAAGSGFVTSHQSPVFIMPNALEPHKGIHLANGLQTLISKRHPSCDISIQKKDPISCASSQLTQSSQVVSRESETPALNGARLSRGLKSRGLAIAQGLQGLQGKVGAREHGGQLPSERDLMPPPPARPRSQPRSIMHLKSEEVEWVHEPQSLSKRVRAMVPVCSS